MDAILSTLGLTKTFDSFHALHRVNFEVGHETIHSVIGPNGAGKTTLFNLITGTIPASLGKIFFQGKEITHIPQHMRVRAGIGRSFQITNIFPELTVFENVRLAVQSTLIGGFRFFSSIQNYSEVKAQTDKILEYAGLNHLGKEKAEILSHGDQRHLEIAIALATKPKLLLLDEPTAGMSQKEIGNAIDLIKKISQTTQVLLVEHKMEMVMFISDVITVLNQGEVIATGSPSEIKANPEVKRAYLGD